MSTAARAPRRFWSRVDITVGCWLWRGSLNHNGYGQFSISTTNNRAHRVAYHWLVGEIPEGLELDHLCRVRHCVNPAHLEPVTPRVNMLRGDSVAAINARKTHCVRGHVLAGRNVRIESDGGRRCRACAAQRMRRVRAELKAAS